MKLVWEALSLIQLYVSTCTLLKQPLNKYLQSSTGVLSPSGVFAQLAISAQLAFSPTGDFLQLAISSNWRFLPNGDFSQLAISPSGDFFQLAISNWRFLLSQITLISIPCRNPKTTNSPTSWKYTSYNLWFLLNSLISLHFNLQQVLNIWSHTTDKNLLSMSWHMMLGLIHRWLVLNRVLISQHNFIFFKAIFDSFPSTLEINSL